MPLYFDALPSELLALLLSHFSSDDLCKILNYFRYGRLDNKVVWNEIWKRDISLLSRVPDFPCIKYIEIFSIYNGKRRCDHLKVVKNVVHCHNLYYELIEYLAENNYDVMLLPLLLNHDHKEYAIRIAASHNHPDLVAKLLNIDMRLFTAALAGAIQGNHIDIVKSMLQIGKKFDPDDLYHDYCSIFTSAAIYNRIEIMDLLLQIQEEVGFKYHYESLYDYHHAMGNAAAHGNMEVVKKLIPLLREEGDTNFDWPMAMAAHHGNVEIIDLMMACGSKAYGKAMKEACNGGNLDVIKLMIKYAEEINDPIDYYYAIQSAAHCGNVDVVIFLVGKIASVYKEDHAKIFSCYEEGLLQSGNGGQEPTFDIMLKVMMDFESANPSFHDKIIAAYNRTMCWTASKRTTSIVKKLLAVGANNYADTLLQGARGGSMEIIDLMFSLINTIGDSDDIYRKIIYSAFGHDHKHLEERRQIVDRFLPLVTNIDPNELLKRVIISEETSFIEFVLERFYDRIDYNSALQYARSHCNYQSLHYLQEYAKIKNIE